MDTVSMNVLMLVTTDVAHDSRVLREAVVLADSGHAVHIVGKDVPDGWIPPTGVSVESVSGGSGLKPAGSRPVAKGSLRAAARWALLPRHRRRVWRTWSAAARAAVADRRFDVVHAHDFNVLQLAADLADRQVHGRRTPVERALDKRAERRIVRRADAVLTVSDGIARNLGRWRPEQGTDVAASDVVVVRNTFPAREQSTVELPQRPVGVVYAGRIGAARDLETLLAATASIGLTTRLMGPVERGFLEWLRPSSARVRIEPARPVDEVDDVLRTDGISVVTLTNTCENHRLALPNKLFHAVRAGVPVLAADLPEMRRLVTQYGLGQLYRPGDVGSMRAALERLIEDYPQWCEQVAKAAGELSWEQDAMALSGVYDTLARRVDRVPAQPVSVKEGS
jgi:glycogen(starch) synthase